MHDGWTLHRQKTAMQHLALFFIRINTFNQSSRLTECQHVNTIGDKLCRIILCWIQWESLLLICNETVCNDDIIGPLSSRCELLFPSGTYFHCCCWSSCKWAADGSLKPHFVTTSPAIQTAPPSYRKLMLFISHASKFVMTERNYALECRTVSNLYTLKTENMLIFGTKYLTFKRTTVCKPTNINIKTA